MPERRRSGVDGDLFLRTGKGPGDGHARLGPAEDEAELARRAQALGPVGTVGGTRTAARHRTELVGSEEAVLAGCRPRARPSVCHVRVSSVAELLKLCDRAIKAVSPPARKPDSRKTQELRLRPF